MKKIILLVTAWVKHLLAPHLLLQTITDANYPKRGIIGECAEFWNVSSSSYVNVTMANNLFV